MSESALFLPDPAQQFHNAVDRAFDDVQQRRLRYHLLRLTVAGLSRDDRPDLLEVARLAFAGEDVGPAVAKVQEREGVTELAVVLAKLVGAAGGRAAPRDVLLGAVLGAYAGIARFEGLDDSQVAIVGAVAGAVAAEAMPAAIKAAEAVGEADYLRLED